MDRIVFEDLSPGAVLTYGSHRVDRDEMVAFAREFDAQPFHVDEAAARASPVGDLIASGWYTVALSMRMWCDGWFLQAASMGGAGIDALSWLKPVRAGDRLTARQTVVEARPSRSRPEIGLVQLRTDTLDEAGEPVMSHTQWVMLLRRGAEAPDAGSPPAAEPAASGPPEEAAPGGGARTFEAVEIGREIPLGSYRFTRERILAFAERFDPQPFHLDEDAAARGPFGALAASGWHTAAAWMRGLVAHRKATMAEALAEGAPAPAWGVSPGFTNLRWSRPVHRGDTVLFATTATAKRLSASRPGWGIVQSRNTGHNQRGELVFSFEGSGFWRAGETG